MKAQLPLTYENYIFDLYGTLVDIHTDEELPALWEKMSLFYGYYGARYSAEELHQAWDSQTSQCRGQSMETLPRSTRLQDDSPIPDRRAMGESYEAFPEIDITLIIRALFERKKVTPTPELIIHTGQFFRVLSTEYIRLYEGTRELLDGLHTAGKKVWLLTNAQRIFTRYELHMLDIDRCFDGILISSDFGISKPDSRFFLQLSAQFSINFSSSLFIGNDAVNDIGGAIKAGLDSFYVHSNLSSIMPAWLPAKEFWKLQNGKIKPLSFRLDNTVNYTVMDFTGWESIS